MQWKEVRNLCRSKKIHVTELEAQLIYVLLPGELLSTDAICDRIYNAIRDRSPTDPRNTIKVVAHNLRKKGFAIAGDNKQKGYKLAGLPWEKSL